MKRIILIIILPIVFGASCKKTISEGPLPPSTQIGANTMGCFINGKAWLPDTKDNGSIPRLKAIHVAYLSSTELSFSFYRQHDPDNQNLMIYLKDFKGTGSYTMNQTSRIIGLPGSYGPLNSYFDYTNYNMNQEYITNEVYSGTLNIVYYNETDKIIAGNFNFKGQNIKGSSDSVIVKDGRFDCKFY